MDTLTLTPDRSRDDHVAVSALFVVVDAGRPRTSSRHLLIDLDRVILGRGAAQLARRETATLRLELPDPHLSTEHAVVERALGGWTLRDLDSKNGVFVNGERVAEQRLDDGDWIELGETFLRFRVLKVSPGAPADLVASPHDSVVPGVEHALRRLADIAPSPVSVLLTGESGAGKELAARRIHELSARPGAFVAVTCIGLVEDLDGALQAAQRGTLLLDEVADLPLATQAALLRALQEPLDVRIVAATHKDLEREVDAGRFRVDLYARLAGLRVTLPPLRQRIEDLGTLVVTALARHAPDRELGLSSAAVWAMCRDRWPLNLRELDQAIAAAATAVTSGRITLDDLPEQVAHRAPAVAAEVARREELLGLLRNHKGNLAAIARALETSRTQIHRLLRRYNLDPDTFRG